MTHQVTEEDLRENFRAHDDGRTFWQHATDAGLEPERWRECREALADLVGWVELHIEQGPGAARQTRSGSASSQRSLASPGSTSPSMAALIMPAARPMGYRADASLAAAETVVELEKLANAQQTPTVGTAGVGEFGPGMHNVIPGEARLGLDVRSVETSVYRGVVTDIIAFARTAAAARELTLEVETQDLTPAIEMDAGVVGALEEAAEGQRAPVPADALGRRPRHPARRAARAERDGVRSVQGRHQPFARPRMPIPPTRRPRPRS